MSNSEKSFDMEIEKSKRKVLIVEDESDKLQGIARILRDEGGISLKNILIARNAVDAIRKLEDDEPQLILLDLKIPRKDDDPVDICNAIEILKNIELYNFKNNFSVKVIIVSASIQDYGLQKLIIGDRSDIVSFIDKNDAAINSDDFKDKLLKQIEKAFNHEMIEKKMDYSSIRKSGIRKLQDLNKTLWEKIDNNILNEFECLTERNVNIHTRAKQIIGCCGEIVEDIVTKLNNNEGTVKESNPSIGKILDSLTGRKRNSETKAMIMTGVEPVISRSTADYAYHAYRLRSEALHSAENDLENTRVFKGKTFTREDAAISINLIVPLILEYIEILKNDLSA